MATLLHISLNIFRLLLVAFFMTGGARAFAQEVAQTSGTGPTTANNPLLVTQVNPATPTTPVEPNIGTVQEDAGVMDRARPRYDAKGIPLGGFRLFPSLDLTSSYDDNVFRQPKGEADWYLAETPSLRLMSQWGRHFLEFYAGANNYNYARDGRLNLTDWDAGADGRYDIMRGALVTANVSYGKQHESLASPNTLGSQYAPNRYYKTDAKVTASYQPNRLGFEANGTLDRYVWTDTPLIGGGILNNSDRNENEYQAYGKLLYNFSPGYTAFVKGSYDSRVFDEFYDRGKVHRSSTGYRANGGLDLQLTNLLTGEVYAGYLEQHYASDVPDPLRTAAGLDFGAALDWYATPILTVHLNAWHVLTDVTIAGSSASSDESIRLSADYEAVNNIILQGYMAETHSKFIGVIRTDDYPSAGISGKYLLDTHLSIDLAYNYSERSSNLPVTFQDDMVTISITSHI